MEKLLAYINSLAASERDQFATRCGTTVGYLRNACSTKKKMSMELCLGIATESQNAVPLEAMRPDVDWEYMRHAMLMTELAPAATSQGQEATQPVAPQPDALRAGVVRRQEVRRMDEIVATVADRRVNEEFAQLPVVPVDPAAPIDSQGV